MSKSSIARRINLAHGKYKHGYSAHPIYKVWRSIQYRCYNPSDPRYSSHGGRGIKVCERWLNLDNFISDVGLRPSAAHFFSRIDINKDFSPDNCEWSMSIARGDNTQVTHEKSGLSKSSEYSSWKNMRARCGRKSAKGYEYYGGRGIRVCERWLHSFTNFYEDMGEKPSPSHSIDRIDVNGDYTPENCRWSSFHTQSRNKRSNVKVEYRGNLITYDEAIALSGLSYKILNTRIKSLGWDVEKAIHTPLQNRGPKCQ